MKGKRSIGIITAALITIALAAASFIGTYAWRESRINSLKRDNQSLQTKLTAAQGNNLLLSGQLQAQNKQQASKSTPASPTGSFTYTSAKGVPVLVYYPASGSTTSSPVAVLGQVPGNWSFEAQFPVKLMGQSGQLVAQGTAHVLGDWMTGQLVPFSAQLIYTAKPSGSGLLVLEKDNPSGLAANQDSVVIPVMF